MITMFEFELSKWRKVWIQDQYLARYDSLDSLSTMYMTKTLLLVFIIRESQQDCDHDFQCAANCPNTEQCTKLLDTKVTPEGDIDFTLIWNHKEGQVSDRYALVALTPKPEYSDADLTVFKIKSNNVVETNLGRTMTDNKIKQIWKECVLPVFDFHSKTIQLTI